MVPFRNLPHVNGAADEDLSIHLGTRVGPAKPLPPPCILPSHASSPGPSPLRSLLDSESEEDSTEKARFDQAFLSYASTIGKLPPATQNGDGAADFPNYESNSDSDSPSEIRNHFASDNPPHSTSILNPLSSSPLHPFNAADIQKVPSRKQPSQSLFSLEEDDPSYEFAGSDTYTETDSDIDRYTEETTPIKLPHSLSPLQATLYPEHQSFRGSPRDYPALSMRRLRTRLSRPCRASLLVFMASFVLALLVILHSKGLLWSSRSNSQPSTDNSSDIAALVSRLEVNVNRLSSLVDLKLQAVSDKLQRLESSQISSTLLLAALKREFAVIETVHGLCDDESDSSCVSLAEVSVKLERIQQLSDNAEQLKAELLDRLMQALPLTVPVYFKDGIILFTPEFHDHLYTLLDAYMESRMPSLHNRLENSSAHDLAYVTQAQFKELLASKLDPTNTQIQTEINSLVERHLENPLGDTKDFERDGNKIYVENLIKSDGSRPANYAEYDKGARILGFLTSSDTRKSNRRLVVGRIFLGWYDCLLSPPRHQANIVLASNNGTWMCGSNSCSIGVHLSEPVVVHDIVIHHSEAASPKAEVYLRPSDSKDAQKLKHHLDKIMIHQPSPLPTRYLKLFLRVKEQHNPDILARTIRTTLRLSPSVVHLGVPSRDIYIGLSPRHTIHISRIEVLAAHNANSNHRTPHNVLPTSIKDSPPSILLGDDQVYVK